MITQKNPNIAWFVDRDRERRKFQKILDGESVQRIMMIRAGAGMGKTWLINNFRHECSCRQIPYAIIDFSTRSQGYNYLEVLRSIRDSLGAQNFNDFTVLVNQCFIRSNPFQSLTDLSSTSSVDIKSSPQESSIDNVAGRDIIRDNNFFFTRPDTPPELLRSILTDCFKNCLQKMIGNLLPGQFIVWHFDSFEKIDPITREWILEEFLQEIKEQAISQLIIVLAGQDVPTLPLDWKLIASQYTLEPWTLNDYQEYLGKKQMELDSKRIQALHRSYSGRPLDLAMWVDAASPNEDDEV
jgi:hypothetical protein